MLVNRTENTFEKAIPIPSYPSERFNEELEADNVIELKLDYATVRAAYDEVEPIVAAEYFEGEREIAENGIRLRSFCPGWNGDLRWISSVNETGFAFFDRYFDKLGVVEKTKKLLGNCGDLIMYSGFFVVRSHTSKPYFHVDFSADVGLNAFTLMTPVTQTGDVGNLLYHDAYDEEQVYKYSRGKAACFGGGFYHSTEPFESTDPYVFLCFTFGVTDMELWDAIAEAAAEQSPIYRHPTRGIVKAKSS